ncbi:class I SAM-dependent methyltransferase [Streptomyces sp. NPDC055036]
MYGRELAEVYEAVYRSRGKDWAAEAAWVAGLIRSRAPASASLLDVACGTGAHLAGLGAEFTETEGLEISAAMRELARRRLPGTPLHDADMRDFDLGRTFSAVSCLFCAIGYVGGVPEMRGAIGSMARHLAPGGVLVVEPWWFPERFIEGYVGADLARENGRTIARVSHSTRHGRSTVMEVRFTVADADGIREFTEIDLITLFTREEYERAFMDAGCSVEYLPGPPTGRGVFIGVRRG